MIFVVFFPYRPTKGTDRGTYNLKIANGVISEHEYDLAAQLDSV